MFRQDGRRVFERGVFRRPARVSRTNPFPRPRPPFPAMEPTPFLCRTLPAELCLPNFACRTGCVKMRGGQRVDNELFPYSFEAKLPPIKAGIASYLGIYLPRVSGGVFRVGRCFHRTGGAAGRKRRDILSAIGRGAIFAGEGVKTAKYGFCKMDRGLPRLGGRRGHRRADRVPAGEGR